MNILSPTRRYIRNISLGQHIGSKVKNRSVILLNDLLIITKVKPDNEETIWAASFYQTSDQEDERQCGQYHQYCVVEIDLSQALIRNLPDDPRK